MSGPQRHLQGLTGDPNEHARNNANVALLCIARENPVAVRDVTSSVVRLLEDPDDDTRKHPVQLFGELSQEYLTVVSEESGPLVRRTRDDRLNVRETVLRAVASLALSVPDEVTPHEDAIRNLQAGLDDDYANGDDEFLEPAIEGLEGPILQRHTRKTRTMAGPRPGVGRPAERPISETWAAAQPLAPRPIRTRRDDPRMTAVALAGPTGRLAGSVTTVPPVPSPQGDGRRGRRTSMVRRTRRAAKRGRRPTGPPGQKGTA